MNLSELKCCHMDGDKRCDLTPVVCIRGKEGYEDYTHACIRHIAEMKETYGNEVESILHSVEGIGSLRDIGFLGDFFDVVFEDGPGPVTGRFVEVEDSRQKSIGVGEWVNRPNGMWALRIKY